MKVQLVPVEFLRPHEEVIPKNVDQLERMTLKWDAYTKPLLVDRSTGTILDGHHRYEIAKRLELKCLPCVLVDYLSDESIKIILWPNSKWTSIDKRDVIDAALNGNLMPPKTSRHLLSEDLPPISVSLSRLLSPATDA